MAKMVLSDTIPDVIIKMEEGNHGTCTCLVEILAKKDWFGNLDIYTYYVDTHVG